MSADRTSSFLSRSGHYDDNKTRCAVDIRVVLQCPPRDHGAMSFTSHPSSWKVMDNEWITEKEVQHRCERNGRNNSKKTICVLLVVTVMPTFLA